MFRAYELGIIPDLVTSIFIISFKTFVKSLFGNCMSET
jgi:hypothetical protein